MGCTASKSGELASRIASTTKRIGQLSAQTRHSPEDQRQLGAAFVELGSQLALLSRLLGEQDPPGDKQVPHKGAAVLNEQLPVAQQQELAEQLSMAQQACAALKQQLDTAQEKAARTADELAAAHQHEAQLQEQVQSHEQQRASHLEGRLSTAQQDAAAMSHQETASLQEQLSTVKQDVASLHQQMTASQQRAADLQEQLSSERSKQAALEETLAELTVNLEDRSTALQSAQKHVKQLQETERQQEEARAAAVAQHQQLSADFSKLLDSSKVMQQDMTEVRMQLEGSQQERALLKEQLARLEGSNQLLTTQLDGSQKKADNLMDAAAMARQETAALQQELSTVKQEVLSLHQQMAASQQRAADLQEQLSSERSKQAALEAALAELRVTLEERSTELESAQQHVTQLQEAKRQQEEASAAAAAEHKQLSTDHSKLLESSKVMQRHVTEVCIQLKASQREKARLQEQLARLEGNNQLLTTQLDGSQKKADNLMVEAANRGQEAGLLQRNLAEVHSSNTTLSAELAVARQEVMQLREQVQVLKSAARTSKAVAEKMGTEACENKARSGHKADSSSSSNSDNKLLLEAIARLALQPCMTIQQLLDYMAPSRPAAVKAAGARGLAIWSKRLGGADGQPKLAAFKDHQGISRLVQLLTAPDDDDTQLAALEAWGALWSVHFANKLALQLVGQPGAVDTLVQLLHEGGAAKQAAAALVVYGLFAVHGSALPKPWPEPLAPAKSDPNSWPLLSGLVAVMQAPAVSARGKKTAACAMYYLVRAAKTSPHPAAVQLYPAVHAAVKPLEALLQHEDMGVRDAAADALGLLGKRC